MAGLRHKPMKSPEVTQINGVARVGNYTCYVFLSLLFGKVEGQQRNLIRDRIFIPVAITRFASLSFGYRTFSYGHFWLQSNMVE